ncbi:sensor histidine kinase [Bradyrhizobium murdochi]|uniref:sensor histidine kinase n=1 Tax=Bradyrhizobium murdochi TaxID=1038859 RepID=UPI00041F93E7|nr:ABC transporter substrate binding protein [Bradyrhizobium murdochi]
MSGIISFKGLIVVLFALLAPTCLSAQQQRPHSILVLDQSDLRGPFYYQVFAGLRDVVSKHSDRRVTLYSESLDLSRFNGPAYEEALKRYLKEKYQGKPLGTVVGIGAATTELVLKWRDELWPGMPIVFAMIDEADFARLKQKSNATGVIVKIPLADSIQAARAVVPDLDTVALVGDDWNNLVIYRNWNSEIAASTAGLKVIEIIGQKMSEIRKQVAELPDRSAIIYSAVYSDGEDTFYPPATAVKLIAEKANRPIVVAAETFLGPGIGGYVLVPSMIGAEAAKLALRILDGTSVSDIQPVYGGVKPIFDWPQMQRWNVGEASLPEGSEIRFRDPTFIEKYRWQSMAIASAILAQAGLIMFLLHERHLRRNAELESHQRMTELAHVNRQATTGELSSSIAHELNQPLGSILTNAETAELILKSDKPDLGEIREILADIKRDDQRAGEVIRRLRGFLKRTPFETRDIDLNEVMGEAFKFLSVQASARNVALYLQTVPGTLRIKGDPIQLQQVILNLVVNAMDAMATIPYGRTVIGRTELNDGSSVVISISDSGPGIPADKLAQVFDPFFTTKDQGMGIGLSIARTIILAHKGQIWAENQSGGGAAFHFTLPLAA